MAVRPIFIPLAGRRSRNPSSGDEYIRGALVEVMDIEIQWHGGFAVSQKQKNVIELHRKAEAKGIAPVLEISTKSNEEIGRRLSAFSLKILANGEMRSLESVYQSCKVFSQSGQFLFLQDDNPFDAKKQIRQLGVGEIVSFRFEGKDYATEPKNAFYDWLYLRAIAPHEDWLKGRLNYAAYSDIEFTPGKSINCQARAVAEFHALSMRGKTIECAADFEQFRSYLKYSQKDDEI